MTRTYEKPFRLILPEQKRLRESFNEVMDAAGLSFQKATSRAAQGITRDKRGIIPDLETYELRADAALEWLGDGAASMIVTGEDSLREYQASDRAQQARVAPEPTLTLARISCCALWIAAKPEIYIRDLSDLGDMRLATSYPALLQQLLTKADVKPARIIAQKGGVESTIAAGRADAIFEIVQTGASLASNGLEKKLLAFNSSAVLVQASQASSAHEALARALTARLAENQRDRPAPRVVF